MCRIRFKREKQPTTAAVEQEEWNARQNRRADKNDDEMNENQTKSLSGCTLHEPNVMFLYRLNVSRRAFSSNSSIFYLLIQFIWSRGHA